MGFIVLPNHVSTDRGPRRTGPPLQVRESPGEYKEVTRADDGGKMLAPIGKLCVVFADPMEAIMHARMGPK